MIKLFAWRNVFYYGSGPQWGADSIVVLASSVKVARRLALARVREMEKDSDMLDIYIQRIEQSEPQTDRVIVTRYWE